MDDGLFPPDQVPLNQMSEEALIDLGIRAGNIERTIRYLQSNRLSPRTQIRAPRQAQAAVVLETQCVLRPDLSSHSRRSFDSTDHLKPLCLLRARRFKPHPGLAIPQTRPLHRIWSTVPISGRHSPSRPSQPRAVGLT